MSQVAPGVATNSGIPMGLGDDGANPITPEHR